MFSGSLGRGPSASQRGGEGDATDLDDALTRSDPQVADEPEQRTIDVDGVHLPVGQVVEIRQEGRELSGVGERAVVEIRPG